MWFSERPPQFDDYKRQVYRLQLYSLFWVAAAEALFRDTSVKAWACALREGNAAIAK